MTSFAQWAARHPAAAADLLDLLNAAPWPHPEGAPPNALEAWAQQQVRMSVARQGAVAFRNNVGATPAKCPDCGAKRQPVRYGLANDSQALNQEIKSHDLILAIPRVIRPEDVGRTVAQFGSVEVKRPGWKYTGRGQEAAQAAWGALINRLGGFAAFSTGDVKL